MFCTSLFLHFSSVTPIVMLLAFCDGYCMIYFSLRFKDISDLFGSDLPTEGEGRMRFTWRDGPFLKALKNSEWILLDEVQYIVQ